MLCATRLPRLQTGHPHPGHLEQALKHGRLEGEDRECSPAHERDHR